MQLFVLSKSAKERKRKVRCISEGTDAKMARYMAENQIEDSVDIKNFDRLGYVYRDDLSN